MRRLVTLIAMILLFTGASPILACMTAASMSPAESACCQAMHGDCGEMAKTGCCRVDVKPDAPPQVVTPSVAIDVSWTVIEHAGVPVAVRLQPAPARWKSPDAHSPPGLIVACTANLRV